MSFWTDRKFAFAHTHTHARQPNLIAMFRQPYVSKMEETIALTHGGERELISRKLNCLSFDVDQH